MRDCSFYPLLVETFLFTALENPASEYGFVAQEIWIPLSVPHVFMLVTEVLFLMIHADTPKKLPKMATLEKESPFPNDYFGYPCSFSRVYLEYIMLVAKKKSPHPKK